MTIRNTSYDTTIGVGLVVNHTTNAIKEAFIKDMLYNSHLDLTTSLDYKPVFITGKTVSESNIPFFAHPLLVKNAKGINFICSDIRPFIKQDTGVSSDGSMSVRNQTEFNFVKSRMILNLAWLTGGAAQIKMDLNLAGTVFAAWLSETISKRFALDPKDQMVLMIISHYYYQSLFYRESSFDEDMLQKFALHTIKASKAPSQLVLETFDKIKPITSIRDYCQNVRDILENVRLKDLNDGLLITIIGMSWYGLNAKEILAVALEHPPTWVAIVYVALMERTYKNSMIAQIAVRYGKNHSSDEFLKAYAGLIENYIESEPSRPSFNTF